MFSDEFMRFLIQYQSSEMPVKSKCVTNLNLPIYGKKLAVILLTVKK
ncbi:hypothetical protein IJG72_07315 [bacterium]|nr:hypothetical protein [bacterium]